MPYSKPSGAPDWVASDKKAQWVEVWNSVYKAKKKAGMSDKDAEGEAFKQAGGVVSENKEHKAMKIEQRYATELRADGQGDEMAIGGYAALFNSPSHNLGGFIERIAPGAFTRSLQESPDVKALFNHDANMILGRTKSGTLSLSTDERGLKWRAVLDPNNSDHRNIHASIKRGDISDCSFAFTVQPGGDDWTDADGSDDVYANRTLKDVNLLDVSAVTYPAYGGTSVDARCFDSASLAEVRSRVDAFKAKRTANAGLPEKRDDDSLEEMCNEVSSALSEKFPYPEAATGMQYGKYWVIETHADYLIVCEAGTENYFKISYHEDEANETYLFGEPEPVEKEWVPSERCKAIVAEQRGKLDGIIAAHKAAAAEHQAAADAHSDTAKAAEEKQKRMEMCAASMGNCEDDECECQNRMSPADEIWADGDGGDDEPDADDVEEDKLRKAAARAERRSKIEGARTKTVDGKNLTEDKFAFVGDKDKTETWKLPIHDADHVRNALARFNQTEGIPADQKATVYRRIKAAAKKFGIEVSDENSRAIEAALPMDADEIADMLRRAQAAMVEL